ncbi:MAG: DUF3240 family protein [Pseudomonadales bacterium]|jgi:hypothetical protein|nr:DUF3240 family protein [Pseudomonadales bacterium]
MNDLELITLHLPPALEDGCIELLLEHEATRTFSSVPARGHGEATQELSLAEQVSGWRREVRIEVLVGAADRGTLLAALRERLPTETVRYRVHAVLEAGDFGE